MDSVIHSGVKLRHLRFFLQIADSGTLSAAARVLGISQPALSKSLAEFEAMMGAPMFLRLGRKMTPTPEGEKVRRHARDALVSLDAAARAALSAAAPKVLSIGLLPTVSTRFFPAVVSRFMEMETSVTLRVETGTHPYLLKKLKDRQIDLMIGRMPQVTEMTGLDFEFLYDEPIIATARADHPLIRQPMAQLLRQCPLVLPPQETIIRKHVDEYLASLGLGDLRPAVETSTLALGRGIVLASNSVWFISSGVVESELASGQLVSLPLGAAYLSGAVGITRPVGAAMSEAEATILRFTRDQAALRHALGRQGAPDPGPNVLRNIDHDDGGV